MLTLLMICFKKQRKIENEVNNIEKNNMDIWSVCDW